MDNDLLVLAILTKTNYVDMSEDQRKLTFDLFLLASIDIRNKIYNSGNISEKTNKTKKKESK